VSVDELADDDATPAGVRTVALLPLRTATTSTGAGGDGDDGTMHDRADLLWLSLATATHEEATVRDLSTIATTTALALSNLRLAARAAERGRVTGVLAERQRLAHEIHDTLAQGFTSIVTQLEAADQVLTTAPEVAHGHLDRARRTARESLGEARRTVEALRPAPLERAALPDALRDVVDRWRDGCDDQIDVSVAVDGQPAAGERDTDAALLRVAQEALTNVARHARASRVDLTLSYLGDLVLLDIQDNGVGFSVDARSGGTVEMGGYGLLAMRERMLGVGGELVVESAPGDGTTVAARVRRPGGDGPASGASTEAAEPR
jgi:signal transduction histidine kinase